MAHISHLLGTHPAYAYAGLGKTACSGGSAGNALKGKSGGSDWRWSKRESTWHVRRESLACDADLRCPFSCWPSARGPDPTCRKHVTAILSQEVEVSDCKFDLLAKSERATDSRWATLSLGELSI